MRKEPERRISTIAVFLRKSAESPVFLTMLDKKRVKKVKLPIKPVTTPRGRFFPPESELLKTIGSTGRIQGDKIVTKPAKKAKRISNIIVSTIHCSR